MPHPIGNIFKIMFKVILDRFIWVMMHHAKYFGMGKVQVKKNNGIQWLLKEVRHVPYLRKSLISTGKLASEGFISIFADKASKVTKGSSVIAKGEKVGTLYLCTGNTNSSISSPST